MLFPWRLHDMLLDAEDMGFCDLVSWLPCGTMFRVHQTDDFAEKVLPKYFNQNRYKSFQRQLNIYGFERVAQGKDKGAYAHKCFIRGIPDLCGHMTRTKIKGVKKNISNKALKQKDMMMNRKSILKKSVRDINNQGMNSDTDDRVAAIRVPDNGDLCPTSPRHNLRYSQDVSRRLSLLGNLFNSPTDVGSFPSGNSQQEERRRFSLLGVSSSVPTDSHVSREGGRRFSLFGDIDISFADVNIHPDTMRRLSLFGNMPSNTMDPTSPFQLLGATSESDSRILDWSTAMNASHQPAGAVAGVSSTTSSQFSVTGAIQSSSIPGSINILDDSIPREMSMPLPSSSLGTNLGDLSFLFADDQCHTVPTEHNTATIHHHEKERVLSFGDLSQLFDVK